MARPSPLVLLTALCATLFVIATYPLLRVLALLAIGVMLLGSVVRALARRRWWPVLWIGGAALALGAFLALVIVRPPPRITYVGDIVSHAPGIVESRGFYPAQTDPSGLRYAWTQDRATVVMDFLVHKPVTLSVVMRSAAVSGGPDAPVHVVVNGAEVGQLRADPQNTTFQPQTLRFIPADWGGEQTEIKFIATPFQPGKGDNRTLGVAVQSLTMDTAEAWSGVARRPWLLWALPFLGACAAALTLAARRIRPTTPLLGYGAVAATALGALCAATLVVLVLRIGVITPLVYRVWLAGGVTLVLCFAAAALALPFGAPYAPSLGRRAATRVTESRGVTRLRQFARPSVSPPVVPETATVTRRALRGDLIALFVFALAVRVIWMLVTPPWMGPDEPDHYIYASHIAEEADIPHPPSPKYPAYPQEQLHSQGITLAGDLSTGLSGTAERIAPYYPFGYDYQTARDYSAPAAERYSEAGGRATGYPPLYFILAALPYKALQWAPVLSRLYAVRFTSALLGALGCVFAYLFAFEIRRERRWGWALGAAMALVPMYVFVTAIANNDAAMDCVATGLLWLTMRAWQRREPGNALLFAIGLMGGLLLFAKPNAPALLVVAAAVVLIKVFPLLRQTWQQARRFLLAIGAFVGGLAVGYGPWLVAHVYYYGDIGIASITPLGPFKLLIGLIRHGGTGPPAAAAQNAAATVTYSFGAYLRHEQIQGGPYFFWLLVKTVWGYFGWLDLPMDDPVYRVILIVCAIGLLGFALQCVLQPQRRSALLLVLAMVLAHVLFLFLVPDYLFNFRHTGGGYGLQGRYLLPVLVPFLFMLLSGWDHLLRERPVAVRLAPFFVLGVQAVALATIVTSYYGVIFG